MGLNQRNKMNLAVLLNLLTLSCVLCFNLDHEYTVVKDGPTNGLFGFSVLQHIDGKNSNNWFLVGAPKGVNKYLNNGGKDKQSGTIYKCNATNPRPACEDEVPFDEQTSGSLESKSNEWLGVSLKSGGKLNEVMSCAHRYESHANGAFRLLEGKCYKVVDDLSQGSAEYNPCNEFNNGAILQSHENYGQCQTGIGLDVYPKTTKDEMRMLFGSVGAQEFKGRLFREDSDDSNKMWVPMQQVDDWKDSYFGYAVALGKFTTDSVKEIAVGGPRHQSHGKVLIYKDNEFKKPNLVKEEKFIAQEIPLNYDSDEIQLASGFGIALCAIDHDNNGLDELVVGAPFYAEKKKPNLGMVFVYGKSKTSDQMEIKQKLYGNGLAYSTFGYAVVNAGDLNLDGYPDLVVGAPHKDMNLGAVFVYQGTNKGFAEQAQVILAEQVQNGFASSGALSLQGFGRSLAAGVDMDNNGYKDVLVGSYISGHAVLLRTRPVIIPHPSITFTPNQIDITNKDCESNGVKNTVCFSVKVCNNITEPKLAPSKNAKVIIKFTLTADADMGNNPRVFIKDSNVYSFELDHTGSNYACYEIKDLYLKFDSDGNIAEYPDIKFTVKHEIPYGENKGPSKPLRSDVVVPSLDNFPILSRQYQDGQLKENLVDFAKLTFKRECDICIPDLKISTKASNYTLRLGAKKFEFNVTIENDGPNPAYAVSLSLKLPKSLRIAQLTEVGKKGSKQCINSTCEGILPALKKGGKAIFTVALNTQNFSPDSPNTIVIKVSSINDEKAETLMDNNKTIIFDIKVVADVSLLAVQSTKDVAYTGEIKGEKAMNSLKEVGKIVDHKYAVRNNGPDLLPIANLTIYWPYETLSGKHLLYLVSIRESILIEIWLGCSSRTECDDIKLNTAEINVGSVPSNSRLVSDDVDNTRVRREASNTTDNAGGDSTTAAPAVVPKGEEPTTKPVDNIKDGITLSCRQNTARCITIRCRIRNLPAGDSEALTIRSRLWEPSMLIDYYGEVVTIESYGNVVLGQNASYLSDPNPYNNVDELYTVVTHELVKSKKKIATWIIALAVVAGIILLALLIFGLFKLGFFKRNRKHKYSAGAKEPEKSLISK